MLFTFYDVPRSPLTLVVHYYIIHPGFETYHKLIWKPSLPLEFFSAAMSRLDRPSKTEAEAGGKVPEEELAAPLADAFSTGSNFLDGPKSFAPLNVGACIRPLPLALALAFGLVVSFLNMLERPDTTVSATPPAPVLCFTRWWSPASKPSPSVKWQTGGSTARIPMGRASLAGQYVIWL